MYGQEIDAYERQESTNHEQDLNNFCLHQYQSSLTWCSLLNINCLNCASSKQTVHKVFKMTFWRLSYSFWFSKCFELKKEGQHLNCSVSILEDSFLDFRIPNSRLAIKSAFFRKSRQLYFFSSLPFLVFLKFSVNSKFTLKI